MLTLRINRVWAAVAGGAVLVSMVGLGTVRSYFSTAKAELTKQMRDAVPIGFELKRLEQLTSELIPEIQANRKVAAQLDTEVEYLDREIQTLEQSQASSRAEMDQLRATLGKPGEKFEFSGRTFTRREVEDDLTRRLAKFDDAKVRLDAKRRILDSRRATLAAATDKIRACQHQHDLLVEKSEALQAELKLLELAEASGNFQFDHSKLTQTRELAETVEKRIRTLHKLVDGQPQLNGEIPVVVDDRPVVDKYDQYFAAKQK
ncbi:MAG TPA: hypothetical protein PLV92_11925 [Pirellulaceae bacterium]|nr:hypothetical protein [Pirellulaceae bacterium]